MSVDEIIDQRRKQDHKRRVLLGYTMALFCAVLWGLWYIPGDMVWTLEPFVTVQNDILAMSGSETTSFMVFAVLITGINALIIVFVLGVWNLWLGKFSEMKRTFKENKAANKWYILASICGGAARFSEVSWLWDSSEERSRQWLRCCTGYRIMVSRTWLGQKISRRAMIGIFVVIAGGITAYASGFVEELAGGNFQYMGIHRSIMAAMDGVVRMFRR